MKYRARSEDGRGYLGHTYGAYAGKPLEESTMKGLADIIAYLYHRHPVRLFVSENGKRFRLADDRLQREFSRIMSDAFADDESRHY